MCSQKLVEALVKETDEKIAVFFRDAQKEIEKIKSEASEKLKTLQKHYEQKSRLEIQEQSAAILSEAKKSAEKILLFAEEAVARKIYMVALSELSSLRDERYKDVFASLVNELPAFNWEMVRVNPNDVEIAHHFLGSVKIVVDSSIIGGFEAVSSDGKIIFNNTLEKRLERAFIYFLPIIVKELYGAITKD